MNHQEEKHTKRNLIIFIVFVLGLAALAGVIEPFTIPPDSEPGTSGLGQLLWLIESQTEEGEAMRDDEGFSHVSIWEYDGYDTMPKFHKEPLVFENVKLSQRSYK